MGNRKLQTVAEKHNDGYEGGIVAALQASQEEEAGSALTQIVLALLALRQAISHFSNAAAKMTGKPKDVIEGIVSRLGNIFPETEELLKNKD